MPTTTTPPCSILNTLIVCTFLTVSGLAMLEPLMRLAAFLPPRLTAFIVAAVMCWLLLDNVTLAFDLVRAVALPNTTTQAERIMLRRIRAANQYSDFVRAQLDAEMAAHRETAARLDTEIIQHCRTTSKLRKTLTEQHGNQMQTALHWSLLASKAVVMEKIERCGHYHDGRRGFFRRCMTTDDFHCSFHKHHTL